ncbi:EamA family transporter [Leucobacter sp. wl10]|uniref:EamA family transporter n=1 Tax=Leucobacter sp. wl10 TaxID=2304677 RepID=UPI000E5B8F4D|nr:EamA family transporter [Leucobacter sp. wl10]RGE21108.1 EamA/RhaT family transporter [Leucobacter sp. wl10]
MREWRGPAAVLAAAVLWGTTGTAATLAPQASPLAIGAAALGIGGLLQGAIAVRELRRERRLLRARAGLIALGAAAVAIYPLAFYSSMRLAGVAVGTVVSLASAPLVSGLVERLVDGRRLGGVWLIAAGLGIAGSAALCLSKAGAAPDDAAAAVLGIGLGVIAGAAYALYSWVVARLLNGGVGRGAAMGSVFGCGGALLMPVLLATGGPLLASASSFGVAAYMALVPMFVGYLLFGYGLTRVRASTATTLTLSEPAVAAVLAVLVVGERLPPAGWIGLATIGAALLVLVAPARPGAARPGARPARRRLEMRARPAESG